MKVSIGTSTKTVFQPAIAPFHRPGRSSTRTLRPASVFEVTIAASASTYRDSSKGLPAATVDRVNGVLETVYKNRFPEDTALDGLKKILAEKATPAA